jgi:hypothetical protein
VTDQITDDELDRLLADAAPQVSDFPPCPRRREQIMRRPAPIGLRRRPGRWPYALIPLATAGLAAAAILLVGGPPSPVQVEPAGAAAVVLNRAADAAQRRAGLPPDRLRYTREIENQGDGPFVVETWTRADGSTARRLVTEHGRSRERPEPDTPGGPLPWTGLSSREIVTLPTGPAKLLGTVRAAMSRPQPVMRFGSDGGPGKPSMRRVPYTDHEVFDALMALHDVALPLSSAQRAALLRAAALLAGVTDLGRVADPLGRPADAITIAGDAAHEGYGRVYLLSATSGQIIATLDIRDSTVAGWFVRQQATVDSTSQRPLPPATDLPPARYRFTATRSR